MKPTVAHKDKNDLLRILNDKVIGPSEAKLIEIQRDVN